MELGEKLRQARMEAGLSQRALCGEEITRNMLSRIENGAARPSMGTLQYLAARLGKPVSYFLEETAVCSPNQAVMAKARQLFDEGDFAGVKQALSGYRAPDETYDRERQLLESVTLLNLAEQAIGDGKELDVLGSHLSPYCFPFVIDHIADGTLKTDGMIQHTFPLEDWETAFDYATGKYGDFKVAFTF